MSRDSSQSSRRQEEYFQGYRQDLTIVASEEVVLYQPEQQQQQQPKESKEKKKKKSCGNRHLQRFRAKLRKQGLYSEAIASIIASRHGGETNPEESTTIAEISMDKKMEWYDQVESN
jgi:hypothetical protein